MLFYGFLTVLENSNESYFVEFTPRDINAKNNQKAAEVREVLDNLNKENESIQKNKYLEISTQEIENKLNNVLNDVKNFCELQIKNVSENYEKIIKK